MKTINEAEMLIKRANVQLANHKATRMFAPFLVAGSWRIENDPFKCPTAYTDGKNEVYGLEFVSTLPNEKQVRFLVMHENGHEFLLHLQRRTPDMKKKPDLANMAMDYAINGMLVKIANAYPDLLEMIPSALYDAKYDGWSVLQIFRDLEKEEQDGSGGKKLKKSLDQHDTSGADNATPEQVAEREKEVNSKLQQGALMAGLLNDNVPQEVQDAMAPVVDWERETEDFLTEVSYGRDDLTLQRYDRRRVADDLYYPDVESETLGEIVIGIDTSGSTIGPVLDKFLATVQDFCIRTKPSKLRVLWWDTEVNSEQVFDAQSCDTLVTMLKPRGGGGTRVGCVSDYIVKRGIKPDAVLILTDGYVESQPNWCVNAPTLWLVTECRTFSPPSGRLVRVKN